MSLTKFFIILAVILLSAFNIEAQDIFEAAKNNNLAKIRELVENDLSQIKKTDQAGNTPLHIAAINGYAEIIEYLLTKGSDINSANLQQNTPLHEAIQGNKQNICRLLIEKGADINKANVVKQTPLHRAASLNQIEIGKLLIDKGAVIDSRDVYLRTPFLLVARNAGNVEFGRLLLKKGADINAKDRDNQKPLNLAAWKGYNSFIELLLDNGALYDTTNGAVKQIIQFAANFGSVRLFKTILEKELNLLADDAFNKRLMSSAIKGGSVEIVEALISKKIPVVFAADRFGWTPVHHLAVKGQAAMIKYIAEKGAEINKRTVSGKTPFNLAVENNKIESQEVLRNLNADLGEATFPELKGEYLGQPSPENRITLFAPDIVSSSNPEHNHGSITFEPGGKEIYWNLQGKIWFTRKQNNKWEEPKIVPFCRGEIYFYDNPFITPDGKKMFFTSTMPGSVSEMKENIWYAERTNEGWSEPKPVSSEVNAQKLHWGISVSSSGTLYFGGAGDDVEGTSDIYYSRIVNGVYTKPVRMSSEINSKDLDHCPYIAPDESYIIFSRIGNREPGYFISFKNKSGQWLAATELKWDIEGVCPLVSPDGKYFFFNGDGIYWMKADFIESMRPKE